MGSSRVGSNPTRSNDILFFFHLIRLQYKTKADHHGDRTHNLPIRSRTPYPLGHAALCWETNLKYKKCYHYDQLLFTLKYTLKN